MHGTAVEAASVSYFFRFWGKKGVRWGRGRGQGRPWLVFEFVLCLCGTVISVFPYFRDTVFESSLFRC